MESSSIIVYRITELKSESSNLYCPSKLLNKGDSVRISLVRSQCVNGCLCQGRSIGIGDLQSTN